MQKKRALLGFLLIAGLVMAPGAFAQTQSQPSAPVPSAPIQQQRREHHPEIRAAIRKLRTAKEDLEKAAHDFGGHRVKAIEAINVALRELEMALQYDQK